jgi:hypothetical protein
MKVIRFVIAFTVMILAFQNCGKSNLEPVASPSNPPSSSKPIAQAKEYFKVNNFSDIDQGNGIQNVSVDLSSGELNYQLFDQRSKSCLLNDSRLQELDSLLAQAKICEATRDANQAYCMAIGIADFTLASHDHEVTLQPIICGSGRDLCGDDAQKLRDIFNSLKASPPKECL